MQGQIYTGIYEQKSKKWSAFQALRWPYVC